MGFSTSAETDVDRKVKTEVIGLTGGMGSGKSVVAGILRAMGHPVYDADSAAKRLYNEDPILLGTVVDRFGSTILDDAGRVNRQHLGALVFGDPKALSDLNGLVHPAVARDFQCWLSHQSDQGYERVFREAAILFESNAHEDCDRVWGVSAPRSLRLERIKKRSGLSEADIVLRMDRQWPQDKVMALCDSVLVNDGISPLVPQVQHLVSEFPV